MLVAAEPLKQYRGRCSVRKFEVKIVASIYFAILLVLALLAIAKYMT